MKTPILLCFFLLTYSITHAQLRDLPAVTKPGSCYAKSLFIDAPQVNELSFPVYTGTDTTGIELEEKEILLHSKHRVWEEKKVSRSSGTFPNTPEERFIWHRVEVPEEKITITIVKNTEQTQDYVWQTFTQIIEPEVEGYTEWREVICGEKVTRHLVNKIQKILIEERFYAGELTGRFDVETKAALTNYQRKNNLPVGNLDFETLRAMAIY